MDETPQQYTRRILSYTENQDAMKLQRATPDRIQRSLRRVTPKQMRKSPGRGKWSIAAILAHLAEAELVGGYRIRMILGKNGTRIQAFDQNVWAKNSNYARQDPKKSLALFRVLRESNLALLGSLPRKKWNHYGMHEERGRETIARVVRMFAGHDVNHTMQIERIVRQFRAS